MNLQELNRASGAAVMFIVGGVVFCVITIAVKLAISVPDINADQAAVRYQDLAQMQGVEQTNLTQLGWVDVARGTVRLPIDAAIQLTETAWKNPASARADLIAREEKASAPAPVRPAKPSAFE
jgi:hypothetical protein